MIIANKAQGKFGNADETGLANGLRDKSALRDR